LTTFTLCSPHAWGAVYIRDHDAVESLVGHVLSVVARVDILRSIEPFSPLSGARRTCASKLTPVAAGCIGITVVESTVVEHAQSSPDLPVPQSARPLWTIGVAVPSEVEMGGTAGVRPQASTYVACTQCVRVSRLVSCDDLGSTVGDPVGGSVQIGSLAVPAVETLEL